MPVFFNFLRLCSFLSLIQQKDKIACASIAQICTSTKKPIACHKPIITARNVSFVIHRHLIIACSCCAVAAQADLFLLMIVAIYFR